MVRARAREHETAEGRGPGPALLRVLHVVFQAGPTNSQWNEHCLPVADERDLTVCSLFPATVDPDPRIALLEGDGSVAGALRVVRRALRQDDFDVVHVHAPASAAILLAACALERRTRADIVFTLHTCWQDLGPRNRLLTAVAFAAFPVSVACGHAAARSIPRSVRRLAGEGFVVVPNGVDVDRIDRALAATPAPVAAADGTTEDEAGERGGGVTVTYVGRLIRPKGPEELLTAFARVAGQDDRLVLVGDGPLRPALERSARELGIADRTRLPGLLPRDEVYRLLGEADVFASPSHGEGLPLSVLEAMVARLPVVLSDIPQHREIVEATGTAELVPVGDVEGLAAALGHLCRLDRADRADLGARNRRAVVDRFSLRRMSDGYHQVYTGLLARLPRPLRSTHERQA